MHNACKRGVNFQNVNPVYAPLSRYKRRATARCGNIFPAREYRINIVFPWPCRKYRPCRGAKMAANGLKNRIRGTLYTFERQFPLTKGN